MESMLSCNTKKSGKHQKPNEDLFSGGNTYAPVLFAWALLVLSLENLLKSSLFAPLV